MRIRLASSGDFGMLLDLWQESFDDSSEYIRTYWHHRGQKARVLLLEEGDSAIGMIHLLPCQILPDQKAYYWYAACITKSARHKGYFRFFVTETLKSLQDKRIASICYPAPGLDKFYRSCGFKYRYTQEEMTLTKGPAASKQTALIMDAQISDFLHAFTEKGTCAWSEDAIRYAFLENASCGGKQFAVQLEDKRYCGFAILRDGYFEINHTNLSRNQLIAIQNDLFRYLSCDRIVCRTVGDFDTVHRILAGLSDSPLVQERSALPFNLS